MFQKKNHIFFHFFIFFILDSKDILFQQSILKIDDDIFYNVTFQEKQSLKVIFERSGEWALIKKSANEDESGRISII